MTGLSMRVRLLLVCAFGLVVTIVAGVVLVSTVSQQRDAQNDQQRFTAALTDSGALLARYTDEETGVRGFLLSNAVREFLTPESQAAAAIPSLEARLRSETATSDRARGLAASMIAAHADWQQHVLNVELSEASDGQLAAARRLEALGTGKRAFDRIRLSATQLRDELTRQFAAATSDLRSATNRLQATLAIVLTFLVLMIIGVFAGLLHQVLGPLSALGSDARRVADGQLDDPVMPHGPPEIRAVASDVEAMRRRLRQELRDGLRAAEALGQQGPAVVALNGALAASVAEVPRLQVATARESAEGILAGDWVDAVQAPDGRVGVVIGDVSGHGPRAAVLALRLKTMLAASLAGGLTPGRALAWACQQLVGDDAEMFATVFVAILDPAASRLTYANAGHPDAYLFTSSAEPLPLPGTGPLLSGMLATWAWGDQTVAFPLHSVLVAYTDGATEARGPDGAQFGTGRLLGQLAGVARPDRTGAVPDLAAVLQGTLDAIHRHSAQQITDDCTFLTVRHVRADG